MNGVWTSILQKPNSSELLEMTTRERGKQEPYNKCIDGAAAGRMDDGTVDGHCKRLIF